MDLATFPYGKDCVSISIRAVDIASATLTIGDVMSSKITLPKRVSPDLSKLDPALQAMIDAKVRAMTPPAPEPVPAKPAAAKPAKPTGRVLPDLTAKPAESPVTDAFAAALAAMPEAERNALLSRYGISAPAPVPAPLPTDLPTVDVLRAEAARSNLLATRADWIGTSRIYIPQRGKDKPEYCDVIALDVGFSFGRLYPEAWIYTQSGNLRRVPAGEKILLPSPLQSAEPALAAGIAAYVKATERVLFSGTISAVFSKTVKISRADGHYVVVNPTRDEYRFSGKPVAGSPASAMVRKCDVQA